MVKRMLLSILAGAMVFALATAAMADCDPEDPNVICYVPTIDHYECYKAKDVSPEKFLGSKDIGPVALSKLGDPNSTENVDVKPKLKWVCPPVDKEGEGFVNPDLSEWLCGYKIKGAKYKNPRPSYDVTNQFQFPAEVEVIKAQILLVPCQQLPTP